MKSYFWTVIAENHKIWKWCTIRFHGAPRCYMPLSHPVFDTATVRHCKYYFNTIFRFMRISLQKDLSWVTPNKLQTVILEYEVVKLRRSCPLPERATFSHYMASNCETFHNKATFASFKYDTCKLYDQYFEIVEHVIRKMLRLRNYVYMESYMPYFDCMCFRFSIAKTKKQVFTVGALPSHCICMQNVHHESLGNQCSRPYSK